MKNLVRFWSVLFLIVFFVQSPAIADSLQAQANCSGTSTGFVPMIDLTKGAYRSFRGGLYPFGSDARPTSHESSGIAIAKMVKPLNTNGAADPNGRIVFLSIGMSNTLVEFSTFQTLVSQDPLRNPRLYLVNGAQEGASSDMISHTSAAYWIKLDSILRNKGVTPAQVQIVWLKEAVKGPSLAFPDDARALQGQLSSITRILKQRFRNLKMMYLSSRIYAGYATSKLNPEPFAYQSGFAVKWLIGSQISGAAGLNYRKSKGPVVAPWLSWGPYLWADGLHPRSDGLVWNCSDFAQDGTHPNDVGRLKVGQMLLNFVHTDSTARIWYLK